MSSRYRIELCAVLVTLRRLPEAAAALRHDSPAPAGTAPWSPRLWCRGSITGVTEDPRAANYFDNPDAVTAGKRLFGQYNCSGCHSNGGGGMGPSLMDDEWIYGGRLEQIHQTLVEGRPNGMPAWGGKMPDEQLWQIAAYVRSMSLPQTLAAHSGPTPSQTPAPVPREASQDDGWSPPPDTTNGYTSTTTGPK